MTAGQETSSTGEEDEVCVHRVRAKLFRLESREESLQRAASAAAEATRVEPAAADASDASEVDDGDEDAPAADDTPRWLERGVGQCRLLLPKARAAAGHTGSAPELSRPRLVMRVEHVGRLILNEVLLASTAPAARATETSLRLVTVNAALQPQSYLLRVKMPSEAKDLLDAINSHIPPDSERQ